MSRIIRDRQTEKVMITTLVPGDLILLESRAIGPADAPLCTTENLLVKETALTGESA